MARASLRVQVVPAHVHPVPDMDPRVMPVETPAVTVTTPEVAAVPVFETTIV